MRKLIGRAVLVAALVLAGARASAAQAGQRKAAYGVAGGLLMPMGDYGDVDNMGITLGAGASFALGASPVRLRIEGTWSQTGHDGVDGNTKILGGMASIVYPFQTSRQMKPYILGGLGYYNVDVEVTGFVSQDESDIGFGGGFGLLFPMTSSDVFVEARFISISTSDLTISTTTFVPLIVGIRFGK